MAAVALPYAPPYDWDALLGYLRARAVPGMERVHDGAYGRTFAFGAAAGRFTVRHDAERRRLIAEVEADPECVPLVAARLARLLDTERDIAAVNAHFAGDALLGPMVRLRPGLRSPGAWDGFELAVRAVLGQQVSVASARGLALRLATLCGRTLPDGGLVFPGAALMAATDLGPLGMPGARRAALRAVAEAARDDPALFERTESLGASVARLRRIPGIGEWTAQYVALRALRCMDAFPHADLALLRAAAGADGVRPSPAALLARAEPWRPWRGYAAQHLWAADPMAPR